MNPQEYIELFKKQNFNFDIKKFEARHILLICNEVSVYSDGRIMIGDVKYFPNYHSLIFDLFLELDRIYYNNQKLVSFINYNMNRNLPYEMYDNLQLDTINSILERIEEFEIIKNNNIDLISLNSLFDFLNIKFKGYDNIHKYIGYEE